MSQRTSPSVPFVTHTSIELPTTIGLDLSDRVSHFHVLSGGGDTLATGKVRMAQERLAEFFETWRGCRLVLESGTQSAWVSRLGVASGLETFVANAREVHLVNKTLRKSDPNDAHLLADIGRTNIELLRPIKHRSEQAQVDLSKLRARAHLVEIRTDLINFVRGVSKTLGTRAPDCSPESFATRVRVELEPGPLAVVESHLCMIANATKEIAAIDKEIARLCEECYPQTALLREIRGVGPVTALTFVLTIDDITRFKNARDVAAYLGLVPGSRSSGASNPQLHITKRGDSGLRRLLVLCANYIMREGSVDCDLKRFGERIAGADGDRKRRKCAKVAVARKLAVLMLHLLKTGEQYDPLYLAKKRGEDELA